MEALGSRRGTDVGDLTPHRGHALAPRGKRLNRRPLERRREDYHGGQAVVCDQL